MTPDQGLWPRKPGRGGKGAEGCWGPERVPGRQDRPGGVHRLIYNGRRGSVVVVSVGVVEGAGLLVRRGSVVAVVVGVVPVGVSPEGGAVVVGPSPVSAVVVVVSSASGGPD